MIFVEVDVVRTLRAVLYLSKCAYMVTTSSVILGNEYTNGNVARQAIG